MKRTLSMVLALMMILGMLPVIGLGADAAEYTVVDKVPVTLDTNVSYSPWGTPWASYTWYPMYATGDGQPDGGTWGAWSSDSHYAEVVAEGYRDAGALHLKSNSGRNVSVGINACLAVNQTYTIGLWAKGTSNSGKVLASYGNGDFVIIGASAELGADWTYYEASFTANLNQFNLMASDWGVTDIYVDNITIKDADGVDMLQGAGNLYTYGEVTKDTEVTKQWPDASKLDTATISNAYGNTLTNTWTPMYPTGTADEGTWAAWDNVHYAEISANGYKDAGSLHLVSCGGKNTGIAINAGMTAGQTYTLGFYAKGTVNTGKVLGMYANGDGVIIGNTESFGAGWNYYEHTFTAGMSQINLVAADWGSVDIYLDNITLKNSAGVDLLSGRGDFYTDEDPSKVRVPMAMSANVVSAWGTATSEWAVMYPQGSAEEGTWAAQDIQSHYAEIVCDGHNDIGALHLKSNAHKNAGVAINAGMTVDETYTLGLWAKGTSNSGKVLASYANGDFVIIGASTELGADWTYYEATFTAKMSQLNLFASDWGVTNLLVDNITLKNSAGVDLLDGYGDFYTLVDSADSVADPIDTTVSYNPWSAPENAWGIMYATGDGQPAGTWGAWSPDSHYAEIVEGGHSDIGALHLKSNSGQNVAVAFAAGLTPEQTYTIGLWAKGTSNSGKVLASYSNGDFVIINAAADLGAEWTYYEASFTANNSTFNLMSADWGVTDIYVDNITILDSNGNDMLRGYGNFKKINETEPEVPEPAVEGLGTISNNLERAYRWYWNGVTYAETDHSKVEISAQGANDTGSLHIWQSSAAPSDTVLGLVTTMAHDLESDSYTLSMNVKGVFYNTEGFYVHPAYSGLSADQFAYLNVNNKLATAEGVSSVDGAYVTDGWINLQWTLPANPEDGENGFMFLTLQFSKYNVGEYYIDNIQVLDPNGNDVLGGAGSFMDSGSEYFPIILPSTGAEILNSNTMYYQVSAGESNVSVSNHVESGITCGDQNFTVTHNGVTQAASNKNVTMQMAPATEGEPIVFAITSTVSSMDIPGSALEMAQRAGEFNIYDVNVTAASCNHSYSDWNVTAAPTYVAPGSRTKTCSLCGDVVTEEIPVLANPVTEWNITLKDNIGVNFEMTLADTDVVAVTVNGDAVDCTVANGKLSIHVAAAQMMDEIAITVNGLPLANTYSVRKYADKVLADNSKSACHELVKNMLVYGGAAQTYFGYNTSNLASSGIEVTAAVPTGEAAAAISGSVSGIRFYSATLVHETRIAVRFYFTGSIEGLTFSQGTPVQKGDLYYVEITDICPQDLDQAIAVSVTNGADTLTVSYSALDYIIRMYAKGGNSAPLVQALYGYYLAAEAYTA